METHCCVFMGLLCDEVDFLEKGAVNFGIVDASRKQAAERDENELPSRHQV